MGLVAPRHVGSSGPGIELGSPALAGRLLTTDPSAKPLCVHLKKFFLFVLLLNCMNYLYILDMNILSNIGFANIFPHSVDCFSFWEGFPLLYGSFLV